MGRGVTIGIGVKIQNPQFVSIGDDTWIDDYVIILAGPVSRGDRRIVERPNDDYLGNEGEVHIGPRCHIAPFVICSGHAGLSIGADSGVASGAKLYSLSHHVANKGEPDTREHPYLWSPRVPGNRQTLIAGPVVLQDATGVGLNSVVLPGSTIESGALVGIGVTVSGRVRGGVTVSATTPTREKDRWDTPAGNSH
jgi:acetyltransferase-like isoleucine patch superfamily enzyme